MDVVAISSARLAVADGRAQKLRERALLSQADLARALGVSCPAVSRWESGERLPNGPTAERLWRLLEVLERTTSGLAD